MSSKAHVRSVIICDDARLEVTGKEILIGVYNYAMLFGKFPTTLSHLVIRVSIDLLDKSAKQFTLHLRDPKGTGLQNCTAPFAPELNRNEPILIGLAAQGLTLYSPGIYSVFLGIDEQEPEKISDFEVRLPLNEVERQRIPQQAINA
jgi:Family of unknown function (DUF6941)